MKTFKLLTTVVALSIIAPVVLAEVSVTGTLISDYLFRGVSQTDSSAAIQLGVDYEHQSGFYAGVWGSNVDFKDDADAEIDYFLGYAGEVNQSFSYDISYTYYTYIGYDSADEADYGEFIANASVDSFTLTFGHAPDYAQSDLSAQYFGAAYDIELADEYTLTLQAGYTFGDAFENAEYIDYSATLATNIHGFDMSAALVNTDIDDDDTADFRFVLGVSYSF